MLENILCKIRSMIRTGISLSTDDSNPIQTSTAQWLGKKKQKIENYVPYGTFGNPGDTTKLILLNKRSNESTTVGLHTNSINRIKKNTKEGEYGVGNHITGANIYFKENGDAIVEIPTSGKVGLGIDGRDDIPPANSGVVTGQCLDPVTGTPFPDTSMVVHARKI